ncbi:MAG TPA: nucleotidyltransferase domain-containing protein [Anaerolineales bacterium]|nr:nucleotidyltransferase domain-containing protein [Anaerolineales bacterium]
MTTRFGLKDSAIDKIRGVLSHYPQVDKAILYGSRAKGNYKNGSDIDLTLHGGKDLTLNVLYRIMDELDDLLLPYIIDLSIFHTINDPDVIQHIRRVGVTFYDKSEAISELAES